MGTRKTKKLEQAVQIKKREKKKVVVRRTICKTAEGKKTRFPHTLGSPRANPNRIPE